MKDFEKLAQQNNKEWLTQSRAATEARINRKALLNLYDIESQNLEKAFLEMEKLNDEMGILMLVYFCQNGRYPDER